MEGGAGENQSIMRFEDKTLKCKDCGNDFTFTGGEQAFFAKNNFTEPKRCPDCRRKKKEQQR